MDIGTGGKTRRYNRGNKMLLKHCNFAPILSTKILTSKIKMNVMKPWIESRLIELLGFEDDVVINFVNTQLEDSCEREIDGKDMQVNLTGFLERDAPAFMTELWTLLVAAQEAPNGIPPQFLERKKAEIAAKKAEHERIQAEIRAKQAEANDEKDRQKDSIAAEIARMRAEQEEEEAAVHAKRAPKRRSRSPRRRSSSPRHRRRSRSRSPDRRRRRSRSPRDRR